MFSLSISLGPTPIVWRLLFKTKEAAESAWATTLNPGFTIHDDFGQRVHCTHMAYAVNMEDLDETRLAHIEHTLHEMRTRASIQTRMQGDPVLRTSNMGQNSPAMLSPMMMR